MQILVNQPAAELLEHRLGRLGRDVEIVCMNSQGQLSIESRECSLREVQPEIAWSTAHVFAEGLAADWLTALRETASLRWLQSPAAGHLSFYDDLLARGIRVTGAHVNAIPIAEYVVGAVLAKTQRVDEWRAAQTSHVWQPHEFPEINGSTWLVLGVGAIGSAVAERAGALGAHLVGVRRHPTGREPVHEMHAPEQLLALLGRCDVVVPAAPATQQTRGLADANFFAAMKRGSILVNVARGALIDEEAVIASLNEGHLGAAILDVFATEPLPAESPLWDHPQVVVTPHSSAGGLGRHARLAELFVENFARYCAGRPLLHEVSNSG